jgi:hypothetical protein
MKIKPNAPRFHAFWQHLEGRTILLMKRADWEQVKVLESSPRVAKPGLSGS